MLLFTVLHSTHRICGAQLLCCSLLLLSTHRFGGEQLLCCSLLCYSLLTGLVVNSSCVALYCVALYSQDLWCTALVLIFAGTCLNTTHRVITIINEDTYGISYPLSSHIRGQILLQNNCEKSILLVILI